MKKNILIIISLFIATISFATEAPRAVQESFAKKFPTAVFVKWEKENTKEYEASFSINGTKCSANFSVDGTWLETETTINITELPAAISTAIKSKYADWKITGVAKIETASQGINYEADLKKGKLEKEVLLSANGTFIK